MYMYVTHLRFENIVHMHIGQFHMHDSILRYNVGHVVNDTLCHVWLLNKQLKEGGTEIQATIEIQQNIFRIRQRCSKVVETSAGCLSHMNSVKWLCSPWVPVTQSIKPPPCVREVTGSIPVGDSDFFFVPSSRHVDQFTFHILSNVQMSFFFFRKFGFMKITHDWLVAIGKVGRYT